MCAPWLGQLITERILHISSGLSVVQFSLKSPAQEELWT